MSTDATADSERLDGVPPHVWYRVYRVSQRSPIRRVFPMAQATPDAQLTREIIRARSELGRLSGAGVRAVWTREVGDGTDDDERLAIMGFDSRNNEGERSIVSEPSDYAKPLITPSGDRAVFSKLSDDGVYVVDWDGGNERRVASGFGLVVWRDPSNGREWVYVGSEQAGRDPPAYRLITRHLLDDPSTAEPVWDAQPVSGNSFQLSRDARFAADSSHGRQPGWPISTPVRGVGSARGVGPPSPQMTAVCSGSSTGPTETSPSSTLIGSVDGG